MERIKSGGYRIVEEFDLPVNLHLGSKFPNSLKVLERSTRTLWLLKKFRSISESTVGVIEKVQNNNETNVAIIASREALNGANLLLISANIEDEPNNATTFSLIEK